MSSLNDVPYSVGSSSRSIAPSSVGEKFSLSPDPKAWGLDLSGQAEPDDHLHNPDPIRDKKYDRGGSIFTSRGLANIGCLVLLSVSIITLFAGFPIVTYLTTDEQSTRGGFNLGGVNASGQIPEVTGNFGLIDPDTPPEAYTFKSVHHGRELQLVFSDEFNRDGRTFYPGDDPYWEAVDLHYWGTNNLEWYDPAALITGNGSLRVTLSKKPSHNLDYEGGMMTTWNKFCFTGGLIVANAMLPGMSNVAGLWPAIWTMGNLGRAGFGATNDGMWPYTYDACDVGTLPNQTYPDGSGPELALKDGDRGYDGVLSYLPGQRLSRCTCPGESHPGPMHKDGTYVGRSAPEIDMIEAQVGGNFQVPGGPLVGEVSQSGQWAPFNYAYRWLNTSDNLIINDPTITELNPYMGGVYQQATSCVSKTNQACYSQMPNPCFAVYGFEYKPGYDEGYISWLNDGKQVCTVIGAGMAADERVELSARPVPQEPMYILINLGMSYNFGAVDLDHLIFPVSMYVDYIRVYQPPGEINIGCDPPNFPTKAYIEEYLEAYINPNYTTWTNDFGQPKPKNRLVDQCD
ncbi:glycoside hydrolase family 16 protein [Moniliophthora roreri MCA 2997]|uniref:Glycoside hydrolase family 16 protein n=1 Tax=Moniliophthora roreri (strain MCA 2997) TaxID=1381753 RepID=V2WQM3_MONRO|nr:glycoside hydrolase family 16 protein [Moniliophthora roreri MCA 2997]